MCLHHGKLLCACEPSAWRLVFRLSLAELQQKVQDLQPRLPQAGGPHQQDVLMSVRLQARRIWMWFLPVIEQGVSSGIGARDSRFPCRLAAWDNAICHTAGSDLTMQLEAQRDGKAAVKAELLPAPDAAPAAALDSQQLANGHSSAVDGAEAMDADGDDTDVFAALAALADHAEQAGFAPLCPAENRESRPKRSITASCVLHSFFTDSSTSSAIQTLPRGPYCCGVLQEAVAEEQQSPKSDGVKQEEDTNDKRPVQELVADWRVACSSWLQRARLLLERGNAKVRQQQSPSLRVLGPVGQQCLDGAPTEWTEHSMWRGPGGKLCLSAVLQQPHDAHLSS